MAEVTDEWSTGVALDSGEIATIRIRHEAGHDADVLHVVDFLMNAGAGLASPELLANPLVEDSFMIDVPASANTAGKVLLTVGNIKGEDGLTELVELLADKDSARVVDRAMEYGMTRDFDGASAFIDGLSKELENMDLSFPGSRG